MPLLGIAGRGGGGYTMTLRLEQKWIVDKEVTPGEPTMYYPNPSWWTLDGCKPLYSVGRLETRQAGSKEFNLQCGLGFIRVWTLTRLTFTAPDGTEYELRDQLTNGRPDHPICSALNRGRVFVTSDGTSATFISDADVSDIFTIIRQTRVVRESPVARAWIVSTDNSSRILNLEVTSRQHQNPH